MARPSNRGEEGVSNENVANCFSTGIYIRLSYESYYADSESIENQKKLLRDYLQKNKEYVLREEFIDDGETGTNFKRPAFERMLKAIREGTINCIVVKDLSRFGRNHVEVGDYIERIFPFLGVRFISVNDGYDSFDPTCDKDQLLLSVKNLMHEMYARDVSKKICSSIKIKQKTGNFYRTATIPYGYKMGATVYEIDETVAVVVRRIFKSFVSGDTVYHICSTLNNEGIASPKEYATNKLLYANESRESCWIVSTVKRILKNEVYVGSMVRHKMEQAHYKNMKTKAVDEKYWIRVENSHPAIIDKSIFLQVQRKFMDSKSMTSRRIEGSKHNKKYSHEEHIFKDKIFCGNCKKAMTRVNVKGFVNKEIYNYKGFSCSIHRKFLSNCSHGETIQEDELCNMVNKMVVDQSKLFIGICPLIKTKGKDIFSKERAPITVNKKKINSIIKKYEKASLRVLEEYHQGKIDKSQVIQRRSEIQGMIARCKEQYKVIEERVSKIEKLEENYGNLMYGWLRYIQNPKITKEIIQLFVERIDVYSQKRVVIKMKNTDYVKGIMEASSKGGGNNGSISNIP